MCVPMSMPNSVDTARFPWQSDLRGPRAALRLLRPTSDTLIGDALSPHSHFLFPWLLLQLFLTARDGRYSPGLFLEDTHVYTPMLPCVKWAFVFCNVPASHMVGDRQGATRLERAGDRGSHPGLSLEEYHGPAGYLIILSCLITKHILTVRIWELLFHID